MIVLVTFKQKAWIASLCATIFLAIALTGIYFPYKKSKVEVNLAGERLSKILIDNFNLNEQIADTISINLLQHHKQNDSLVGQALYEAEHDAFHHVYGFNIHGKSRSSTLQGTLQCINPVTPEIYNIIKSIDYVYKTYNFDSNYMARTRYFYAFNSDCIYITTPAPLDTYIFVPKRAEALNIFTQHYSYLNRKFSKDPHSKGTVSTEIYEDQLTHTYTYSVISYIYDLSQPTGDRILGALMYDNTVNDLKAFARMVAGELDGRYVAAKIYSHDSGNEIVLSGKGRAYINPITYDLSKKYSVMVSIDPLRFLFYNPTARCALLLAFLITIATAYLSRWYVIKMNTENMTDQLTQLYNRKVLPLLDFRPHSSLAVIDCNKFKFINDTYGHEMGDKALAFIASAFQSLKKSKNEIIIRLGGDEFCIILPDASPSAAEAYLQQVSAQIISFTEGIPLSISWGVIEWQEGESITHAIKRADDILYQAKDKRKNKQR